MATNPMDNKRMLDLESDLASLEKRAMGMEEAIRQLCGALEWVVVRYAKASDKKDIQQVVMPRIDKALSLVT